MSSNAARSVFSVHRLRSTGWITSLGVGRAGTLSGWGGQVLVDHLGLTPLQAITCATKESARALRLHGKVRSHH